MRLGILTSHPIQYHTPWFRSLAKEVNLEVFFAHQPEATQQGDGFGKAFQWDVDLLSGYRHQFLRSLGWTGTTGDWHERILADLDRVADLIDESGWAADVSNI